MKPRIAVSVLEVTAEPLLPEFPEPGVAGVVVGPEGEVMVVKVCDVR